MRLPRDVSGDDLARHQALRVGTLRSILDDVAAHRQISREELAEQLFG